MTLGRVSAARYWTLFVFFLLMMGVVAYLNREHVEQQTNFWNQYVSLVEHYTGDGPRREVLTYPTWGYPFLLWVLPSYGLVVILQILLAAGATTALFCRLREALPSWRNPLFVVFALAFPWFLFHSVKWPASMAASLLVYGLVILDRALDSRRILTAAFAGLLFGLALYFRSEFLLLPLFILFALPLARRRGMLRQPGAARSVVLAGGVSLLVMVPWSFHYYRQTGEFSLTSSQGGIVAFISLGQYPGNPWNAVYSDEYAFDYLERNDVDALPYSPEGSEILMDEFLHRVAERPGGFVKKMAWNAGLTLVQGFYVGEFGLVSSREEELRPVQDWMRAGILSLSLSDPPRAGAQVWIYGLYWFGAKALSAVFVIVAVTGLVVAVVKGQWPSIVVLCGLALGYQLLLCIFLTTEPRYLSGVSIVMIPFVLVVWEQGKTVIGKGHRRREARSPDRSLITDHPPSSAPR